MNILKLEEFMCADKGNVEDDVHLAEELRKLFKKETIALKTQLYLKKERELASLGRKMAAKEQAKKKEFAVYGGTIDGETQEEYDQELQDMKELQESEIAAIESHYTSTLEVALQEETSRHALMTSQGSNLFWEELFTLKVKHDGDTADLNMELSSAKAEARAELDARASKESSTLQNNLHQVNISTPGNETPGANRARSETAIIALAGYDNERDRM